MDNLERVGGEAGITAAMHDFVGRCYDDVMIGFLFRRAERERIERHEVELMLEKLGGIPAYSGRPLREAHAPHRILGGQFDRRRTLLDQALADHGWPEDVRSRVLAWQESLRSLVTLPGASSGCTPETRS